jgi:O-antigen/teichoic acid export membrane protein
LAKSQIRLQYSGLIIFAARVLSIATGLIFQLMIARATTQSEYGIWFNMGDVLSYFMLLSGVLPFWAMRFTARGKEGTVKMGILANLALSIIAMLIYLSLVPTITSALGVNGKFLLLYFLASIEIVEIYILTMLEACLQPKVPQATGYGLLIAECCKVILGYISIVEFQQLLLGALLSVMTALTIQISYYLKLLGEELKQEVKWRDIKEWIKGSVANIYNIIGNQLAAFIFIILFVYGGEASRSDYGAAVQIAAIISYSSYLAFALYPKLLVEKKSEDITTSIKMVLMFAIPTSAGAIAMPDSYLSMISDVYKEAASVLVVLAVDALIVTISGLLSSVIFGFEKIDEKAKIPFRELVKSRLFVAFSLPYIQSAITLPTTFYFLTTYAQNKPLESAIYVSLINLSAHFVTFLILYATVRKMVAIKVPWKNIAKYIFASAIMATILFTIPHPTRLLLTLGFTAVGGIIYLTLLTTIDKETRLLVNSIWREIKLNLRNLSTRY